ncbi:hypothetical protein AA313_de0204985 [Arthrobotrys entomopaga]|nr:hypothetical protein AA313_de0204985 [Arthrobotrys entomopaga]
MNFGKAPIASEATIKQPPTYHIAPNFTTRPFPRGPYELGTILEDIKHFWPVNNANRVPISKSYYDSKENIRASITNSYSFGGEVGILARILDRSIGGDSNLKGKKVDDDVYHIQKLETVYFFPNKKYLSDCLELPDVKDHLSVTHMEPVYLITGLKIARGATIEMKRGRYVDATPKPDLTVSGNGRLASQLFDTEGNAVDISVGSNATVDSISVISVQHAAPADFVLGIQVMKLYHSKSLFRKDLKLKSKLQGRGATLVDDDIEEGEEENTFIVADLDDDDMQGTRHVVGTDSYGVETVWVF